MTNIVLTEVPDQATTAIQPELSREIQALIGVSGVRATWQGFGWALYRNGKAFHLGRHPGEFEDWRAAIAAVVEKTS